jgi:hypothetical protein
MDAISFKHRSCSPFFSALLGRKGIELVYADLHAPLLSADWLRKAALLR